MIALEFADKNLSVIKCELMKRTSRPSVSLVSEIWMFLRTFNPPKVVVHSYDYSVRFEYLVASACWRSVGKSGLLSDYFGSKKSWKSVDLALTCHRLLGDVICDSC